MNFYTDDLPIIACSTGTTSNTAIALIRISGFQNILDLQLFFDFNFTKIQPRFCHLTNIVFENKFFDNCMIVYFPAGKSFTGENVLEIHSHGNRINVERIIELFVTRCGFRPADPGEFSFRAFKNKKLSLSQVEGLDLFLNANNSLMLDQGLDILQGQLHESYLKLYDLYLKLKSSVELLIDFSEDVGEDYAREMYLKYLFELQKLSESLYERTLGDSSSFLSPEIIIVGETNAGKSTFFNSLLSHERAIVSGIKGTTRDYISEVISINSNNFILVDTAGIRETSDEIEAIGISRSFEKIKSAFFKIILINPSDFDTSSFALFDHIVFDLVIFTHADLDSFHTSFSSFPLEKIKFKSSIKVSFLNGSIGPDMKSGSIGPDMQSGSIGPDVKSGSIGPDVKSGSIGPDMQSGSIGPIVKNIVSHKFLDLTKDGPILLDRHRYKIRELYEYIHSDSRDLSSLNDLAISSCEINGLGVVLSELIGHVSSEDVLNSVFNNFCIGK